MLRKSGNAFVLAIASGAMVVLIFDSRFALETTSEALLLCIRILIPSLFPMIVISSIITNRLNAFRPKFLYPMEKVMGLSEGNGVYYLTGLLGGYPIGAKCVAEGYKNNQISKSQAFHIFQFVNNAGPGFIFGICTLQFSSQKTVLSIWIIQIISSIITAILLRDNKQDPTIAASNHKTKSPNIISNSILVMSKICAWVILSRLVLAFLQKWILWILPAPFYVLLCGAMELTNGTCSLSAISNESLRFIICNILLSFGGICVIMQTQAVSAGLPMTQYWKGKATQTVIAAAISTIYCSIFLSDRSQKQSTSYLLIGSITLLSPFVIKLGIAFFRKIVYNSIRNHNKRYRYAISKEN